MKPDRQETLASLALTRIRGIGAHTARALLAAAGSAARLFEPGAAAQLNLPPGSAERLKSLLADREEAFCYARAAWETAERGGYRIIPYWEDDYPERMRECCDAPPVLYYRGTASMNAAHSVAIVGTRRMTPYGASLCEAFVRDLAQLCPGTLVVSGLAYGVDICAHRAALACGLPTIGVLAHGIDSIYPPLHRSTAAEMTHRGGVLTEFPPGTRPERQNFVRRNRIIAGICEATLVVESAIKGGALITSEIALSYGRECFAFPGRADDEFSAGCNRLIRDNKAALVTSAEDFAKALGWTTAGAAPRAVQRELFPKLGAEEESVVQALRRFPEGAPLNTLVVECNLPVYRLSALLFELEMKGLVRPMYGGLYRLLG